MQQRMKTRSRYNEQMKSNPSTRCLLFGAPTPYFRTVRNKNRAYQSNRSEMQRQEIKGVDQRRNFREEDQRNRSEMQRQELKGVDQRSRSKEPIRDATSGDQTSQSETQHQRRRSKEPIIDATSEEIKGVRLEWQPRSQRSEEQPR
jgi:hypothetical protein